MKDYHMEHMKKIISQFIFGLPIESSKSEIKKYERYGSKINYVYNNIKYDMKHGVTHDQFRKVIDEIKSNPLFQKRNTSMNEKLMKLEEYFSFLE